MPLIPILKKQDENLTSLFWLPTLRYVWPDDLAHLQVSRLEFHEQKRQNWLPSLEHSICKSLTNSKEKLCNVGMDKSRSLNSSMKLP